MPVPSKDNMLAQQAAPTAARGVGKAAKGGNEPPPCLTRHQNTRRLSNVLRTVAMDVHKVANNCISGSYISIAGLITSRDELARFGAGDGLALV